MWDNLTIKISGVNMEKIEKYIPLVGRILLCAIFLNSGVGKIFNFAGTQKYMAANGMPFTAFFLTGAIFLEIAGSLSIITGYKSKYGAWALILFLVPATFIFHSNISERAQMIQFMKNTSIIGALLMISVLGTGQCSLEKKQQKNKE
jgi:putative oxidoreductase